MRFQNEIVEFGGKAATSPLQPMTAPLLCNQNNTDKLCNVLRLGCCGNVGGCFSGNRQRASRKGSGRPPAPRSRAARSSVQKFKFQCFRDFFSCFIAGRACWRGVIFLRGVFFDSNPKGNCIATDASLDDSDEG